MTNDENIIPGVLINDPPMDKNDLNQIEVLSETESIVVWDELIDSRGNHLMLLPSDSWPAKLIASNCALYEWLDDWNKNTVSKMQHLLAEVWPPNKIIYIFWSRNNGVRTVHNVLYRNWINFLYEDEGVLVCSKGDKRAVILSNGRMWIAGTQEAQQENPRNGNAVSDL